MKKLLLSLYAVAFSLTLAAQDVPAKVAKADEKYAGLAFSEALDLYQEAYESGKGNADYVAVKIANCYRLLGDPEKSQEWFSRANKAANVEPINYLYYAQVLAENERYDAAIEYYEKFLKSYPNDNRGTLGIESAKRAKSLAARPPVISINKTSVNSKYSDFGPSVSPEGLIFASNRRNFLTLGYTDKWTGANYLDLYVAQNDGQGGLSSPSLLNGAANTVYHESNVSYSPDGNMMMFTRSQYNPNLFGGNIVKSSIDNVVKLKLMVYTKNANGKWSEATEFPYNDANVSYAHPAFSADGKYVYFASDRNGGFGGTDIWRSSVNGGSFGAPENLGAAINTAGQEMFPYVDKMNTLYFSSNGFAGLGGLDIFRAALNPESGTYVGIANIGRPLNSPSDDFGVVLDVVNNRGFFSSNRPGGEGSDDIYGFALGGSFIEVEVLDAATHLPIENATLSVGKQLYAKTNSNGIASSPLELNKVYNFTVEATRYKSKSVEIDNNNWPIGSTQYRTVYLECDNGNTVKGIVMEEKSKLPIPRATVTLVNKITGEEKMIVTDNSGIYKFDVCPEVEYMVKGEKQGYEGDSANVSTKGIAPNGEIIQNLVLKGPPISSVEFYNIYFDFDRWFIRKNASPDVHKMYEILTLSKDLRVEIGAHTDSRGTNEYNDRLSQRRAQAVVKYLVKRGINRSRIVPKGYGESVLKNRCSDDVPCSEAEHQQNRRVEFKLIDSNNNVVGESQPRISEEQGTED